MFRIEERHLNMNMTFHQDGKSSIGFSPQSWVSFWFNFFSFQSQPFQNSSLVQCKLGSAATISLVFIKVTNDHLISQSQRTFKFYLPELCCYYHWWLFLSWLSLSWAFVTSWHPNSAPTSQGLLFLPIFMGCSSSSFPLNVNTPTGFILTPHIPFGWYSLFLRFWTTFALWLSNLYL